MTEVMETYYEQILAFLTSSSLSYTEKDEQGCKRLDIQQGKNKVVVKVYTNGTIQIQGAASKLKEHFEQVKDSIENHNNVHEILPFEIERFPDILVENIPNVDPIIVRFIKEAIVESTDQCNTCVKTSYFDHFLVGNYGTHETVVYQAR